MMLCDGLDLSLCLESSFGSGRTHCYGFEYFDRLRAREEVYKPDDRSEPDGLKYRALNASHEYARLLAEEREASSPRCALG